MQRRVLWTASASHAAIHIYELAIPALLLLIQSEFGAGDFQMGRIVALYGFLFGAGALPAGALADRVGSKPLLMICLGGSAVCLLGMALSPGLGWLAVWSGALGLCLSIYHPAGTALISRCLPLSGRTFATHGMAGNLGVAGSAALAGGLGALFGWRWALGILAVGGAVLTGLVSGLPAVPPPARGSASRSAEQPQWPQLLLLFGAVGLVGVVYRGMMTFLPKLFAETYAGASRSGTAVGGLLTTGALLVGLIGMYVAGRLVDRGTSTPVALLVGIVGQVPFLFFLGRVGGLLLLPLVMGTAFFHFFTQPPGNHLAADLVPSRLRGLGYGLYFFVSFGMGAAGALLGGWASERLGLARAISVLGLALAPAALMMFGLVRSMRARESRRSAARSPV